MKPKILHRKHHSISRKNINSSALKVLYRLHKFGFLAYLVGGSVRDLMIGRKPKDFDIVTDAYPHRVKRIFRNSRLIGRRFRLVHVTFKDQVIEVSTFRKTPVHNDSHDGGLMLRRENTYGSPEEDAHRRDFTINALFYNIANFEVIDYVNGIEDLNSKLVRTVGDPDIRFKEDPVRMIRAVRTAGRVHFTIDKAAWNAIKNQRMDILKCPPSRNLEEIYNLLRNGTAEPSMKMLFFSGLMEVMMKPLYSSWNQDRNLQNETLSLLSKLDEISGDSPFFSEPLMMAALYFPLITKSTNNLENGTRIRRCVEEVLQQFAESYRMPRRHFDRMTQICIAQRWFKLGDQPRFKPLAFMKRSFFPEALTLAAMRLNQQPEVFTEFAEIWEPRIREADLNGRDKQNLLSLLSSNGKDR